MHTQTLADTRTDRPRQTQTETETEAEAEAARQTDLVWLLVCSRSRKGHLLSSKSTAEPITPKGWMGPLG